MGRRSVTATALAAATIAGPAFAGVPPPAPCSHRTTLSAVADTTVRRGQPNTPAGAEPLLFVREGDGNRALVRFDVAGVAGPVASAELTFTVAGAASSWGLAGRRLGVHRLTRPWSEASATWNCASDANPANVRPDCTGPDAWAMGSPNAPPWVEPATAEVQMANGRAGAVAFDVTADVAAVVAGQAANAGWILVKEDAGSGRVDFAARESGTPPTLTIVTLEPDRDGDGVCDAADVCPATADPDQQDSDGDGRGDACECDGVSCVGPPVDQCRLAATCDRRTGDCTAGTRADGTACRLGEVAAFCLDGTCIVPPSSCVAGRVVAGSGPGATAVPPGVPVFVFGAPPAVSCAAGAEDPSTWGRIVGDGTTDDDGAFCIEYARRPLDSDTLPIIARHVLAGSCDVAPPLGACSAPIPVGERVDEPERLCELANCLDVGTVDLEPGCPH
ncbi:MAG TPA: DNRLRE domain-containing protein [Candidatus Binatia bacterium]|nr:DNRLRE domain-containing protein [Candidatus Binatia bacterium]